MADTPKIVNGTISARKIRDLTPPDIYTDDPRIIDGLWEAMPTGTYGALQKRVRELEQEIEALKDRVRNLENTHDSQNV